MKDPGKIDSPHNEIVYQVEDDPASKATIEGFCEDLNIKHQEESNGIVVLQKIQEGIKAKKRSLLLTDLNLTAKSGGAICPGKVHMQDGHDIALGILTIMPEVPVIIYTGDPEGGERRKAEIGEKLKKRGKPAEIFEVVSKSDTPRIMLLLTAFKKEVLKKVVEALHGNPKIKPEIFLAFLNQGRDIDDFIAASSRRKTSDTSPQGSLG